MRLCLSIILLLILILTTVSCGTICRVQTVKWFDISPMDGGIVGMRNMDIKVCKPIVRWEWK